ncbi:uncharacterized protein BKA55DRAFT_547695 [Fusarium redolens]|uniref:Uncharacterized protein n=1 Tax=Fusarium redolens TaxID=48865 RepID=A0A9P9KUZ8_FUSRE|nr:uncharacterized protein BKA55DRAFT_547695 [Fusarium redolens]KAH7269042.1 hypothetical protein BKA55DRAFT_547695 [Fusarium redolens]
MPFDFKAYDQKCQGLTLEELQREWEHYTRLISGAATSTAVSGCAIPLTLGVSTIGVAMAAPAIHNARKKREIIERHLNRLNATHHTRKRDVLGSMAVSGTIGVVTLGVGSMGADAVATAGAEHGIQSIVANETAIKLVSHAALDGAGMMVEHKHTDHLKKKDARKAFQKAGVFKAVQDAKAAEAGYAIQPYPNNGQAYPVYAAGSSSQALPPPPPPYNVAVGQIPVPPTYNTTPNGYPQDIKTPVGQPQVPQQSQTHLMPNVTGQQPMQQPYDYSQQQQIPTYSAPSPMPSGNSLMFSPPQTPAVQYPPQTIQAPNMQPAQQQPTYQQQTGVLPYHPATTPQPFSMAAMHQALPPATPAPPTPYQQPQVQQVPNIVLPTPPQDSTQGYMPQQVQPQPTGQIVGAPQAGYFPATPTGYPPAVTAPHQPTPQPDSVAQVPPPSADPAAVYQTPVQHVVQYQTGYQTSPTPAAQPQYHQQPGYGTPQHTGTYQQAPAPAPAPVDRRSSFVAPHQPAFAPHAPYNPQDWAPKPQQAYAPQTPGMASPPAPTAPVAQPQMQYQMPPTPLPTGSTVNQYQYDNKGSYFPAQPQTPQMTGPTAQTPQQYPPANYPGTPMHNPVQVTQ